MSYLYEVTTEYEDEEHRIKQDSYFVSAESMRQVIEAFQPEIDGELQSEVVTIKRHVAICRKLEQNQ